MMKRVLKSLVYFAVAGFIFSSSLTLFETAVQNLNYAVYGADEEPSLLAYK